MHVGARSGYPKHTLGNACGERINKKDLGGLRIKM